MQNICFVSIFIFIGKCSADFKKTMDGIMGWKRRPAFFTLVLDGADTDYENFDINGDLYQFNATKGHNNHDGSYIGIQLTDLREGKGPYFRNIKNIFYRVVNPDNKQILRSNTYRIFRHSKNEVHEKQFLNWEWIREKIGAVLPRTSLSQTLRRRRTVTLEYVVKYTESKRKPETQTETQTQRGTKSKREPRK